MKTADFGDRDNSSGRRLLDRSAIGRVLFQHPKESISRAESRTLHSATKNGQLLPQRQVLERDGSVSATDQPERSEQYDKRGQHG